MSRSSIHRILTVLAAMVVVGPAASAAATEDGDRGGPRPTKPPRPTTAAGPA